MDMPGPIPAVMCQCYGPETPSEDCECGMTERALRAGVDLTPEQRNWCLDEIASVEGHTREEHQDDTDKDLGRAVLSAWTDYCRDKGLM